MNDDMKEKLVKTGKNVLKVLLGVAIGLGVSFGIAYVKGRAAGGDCSGCTGES
jgi:hypothetical protein